MAACVAATLCVLPTTAWARPKKPPAKPVDETAPVIEHNALTEHTGKPPVLVRARITDDSGVFEPTLVVRKAGAAYLRVPMAALEGEEHVFAAEVPAELLDADVEYLVEAFDTEGNGPARAGAEDAPLVVRRDVPPEPKLPPAAPAPGGPAPADEGSALPLVIGVGVVVGVVVLVGVGVVVGVLAYTARDKDPTKTRVTVAAPAPVAGLDASSHAFRGAP